VGPAVVLSMSVSRAGGLRSGRRDRPDQDDARHDGRDKQPGNSEHDELAPSAWRTGVEKPELT